MGRLRHLVPPARDPFHRHPRGHPAPEEPPGSGWTLSTVEVPSHDGTGTYQSPNDYGTMPVEAGLISSPDGTRSGAFFECFPPGSIIRAEGPTIEKADAGAWAKLQTFLACQHEWEPMGYRNGDGVCRLCGQWGSRILRLPAPQLPLPVPGTE